MQSGPRRLLLQTTSNTEAKNVTRKLQHLERAYQQWILRAASTYQHPSDAWLGYMLWHKHLQVNPQSPTMFEIQVSPDCPRPNSLWKEGCRTCKRNELFHVSARPYGISWCISWSITWCISECISWLIYYLKIYILKYMYLYRHHVDHHEHPHIHINAYLCKQMQNPSMDYCLVPKPVVCSPDKEPRMRVMVLQPIANWSRKQVGWEKHW